MRARVDDPHGFAHMAGEALVDPGCDSSLLANLGLPNVKGIYRYRIMC